MKKISITLVLYNNDINMIKNTITSCMQDINPSDIYVVDNSTNINLKVIESLYKINYLIIFLIRSLKYSVNIELSSLFRYLI
jgi:hypothetical protein